MNEVNFLLNPYSYHKNLNLNLQEICKYEKFFYLLKKEGNILPKIVFSDLDDTIYSRTPQLAEDRFEKNRGTAGNNLVEYTIGFNNFFKKYYNKEMVVSEISQKSDIILTAGRPIIQKGKIKYINLDNLPQIIVNRHEYKPKAILDYLLSKIKYPEIIELNDDKAFLLLDAFLNISELLKNTVILNQVTLSKDRLNEIEKIETIKIKNGKIEK